MIIQSRQRADFPLFLFQELGEEYQYSIHPLKNFHDAGKGAVSTGVLEVTSLILSATNMKPKPKRTSKEQWPH